MVWTDITLGSRAPRRASPCPRSLPRSCRSYRPPRRPGPAAYRPDPALIYPAPALAWRPWLRPSAPPRPADTGTPPPPARWGTAEEV